MAGSRSKLSGGRFDDPDKPEKEDTTTTDSGPQMSPVPPSVEMPRPKGMSKEIRPASEAVDKGFAKRTAKAMRQKELSGKMAKTGGKSRAKLNQMMASSMADLAERAGGKEKNRSPKKWGVKSTKKWQ